MDLKDYYLSFVRINKEKTKLDYDIELIANEYFKEYETEPYLLVNLDDDSVKVTISSNPKPDKPISNFNQISEFVVSHKIALLEHWKGKISNSEVSRIICKQKERKNMKDIEEYKLLNAVKNSKLTTIVVNKSANKYPAFFYLMQNLIEQGKKCLYFSFGKTKNCSREVKEFLFSLIMGIKYPNGYVLNLDDLTIDNVMKLVSFEESFLLHNVYMYLNENGNLDISDINDIIKKFDVDYVFIDSYCSLQPIYELMIDDVYSIESEYEKVDDIEILNNMAYRIIPKVICSFNDNNIDREIVEKGLNAQMIDCNIVVEQNENNMNLTCNNMIKNEITNVIIN